MVEGIRAVELACGDGVKIARPSEAANKTVARKVIVAARDIAQGQVISADDITILRAGAGLSPMAYWDVVGSRAPARPPPENHSNHDSARNLAQGHRRPAVQHP